MDHNCPLCSEVMVHTFMCAWTCFRCMLWVGVDNEKDQRWQKIVMQFNKEYSPLEFERIKKLKVFI
jgi:hypothetical protein